MKMYVLCKRARTDDFKSSWFPTYYTIDGKEAIKWVNCEKWHGERTVFITEYLPDKEDKNVCW